MLLAVGYLAVFLLLGMISVQWLLPRHRPLNRLWLGMSLGLLEMMWLPAGAAFLITFDDAAHWVALGAAALLALICYFGRDRRPAAAWDEKETRLLRQMTWIVLPLAILSGVLQYTHMMRVAPDGSWNVGQSTYGDLPMHLSFITGLVGKRFPADYPFYPGHRLSYPFLTDSLSSSFLLMGCSLQAAVILPGTLMMILCEMGVMILGREMTLGKKTAMLAALLFFLNGGLGFLYDFDQAAGTTGEEWTVVTRVRAILEGYYKTPTNQPEPNNLRWSNVICDLMIPQRTLLGGWCMGIPCFYLLETLFRPGWDGSLQEAERRPATWQMRGPWEDMRGLILLGCWAGALPLIHTHTFLALGLSSVGVVVYDLIHGDPEKNWDRRHILARYAVYGGIAAALSLPQLIGFTFAQTFQEGGNSFLRFQFNWVNNPGGSGMRDFYLWFYIKNIGLPFIALLAALTEKDPKQRRIFAAAFPIILAAELIRFQPNEYDNNKLFYLAWLLCCMMVANWARQIWIRMRGTRSRYLLAGMTAVAVFLSSALTIWREVISSYQAYSPQAVAAGEYARDETPRDAVFLTGTQHLNPVLSIAGKTIVCGPDLWLYWHGFDTTERKVDLMLFYEEPEEYAEVLTKYGVDYIYVSSYERASYEIDEELLVEYYPIVYKNEEATIYRVPEG